MDQDMIKVKRYISCFWTLSSMGVQSDKLKSKRVRVVELLVQQSGKIKTPSMQIL